jgi:enoyl-CoA hydratase
MTTYETIIYEVRHGVGFITLNRPDSLNALNTRMIVELRHALENADGDKDVRALILTGGPKCFCAGADVKELLSMSPSMDAYYRYFAAARELFCALEKLSKPTIAAVAGPAMGGGCELALACDLRLAGENARFALPEINLGLIPAGGGTQRLPRVIGMGKAKELVFFGTPVDASEAYRIGLVNRVVPSEQLMEVAEEWACRLRNQAPLALQMAKAAVNQTYDAPLDRGLDYEIRCAVSLMLTRDREEGIRAFLEKRKPAFTGF